MVTILLPYEESVYWVLVKVPKVQDHIVAQLVPRGWQIGGALSICMWGVVRL